MSRIWWVNQKHRVHGRLANEVVWAPYSQQGDAQEQWHWRTMWDVKPGDIILHYSDQHIVAISTALTSASKAQNPYHDDDTWVQDGKQITVDITWLEIPIAKDEIALDVRQRASRNQGPFQKSGLRVKQGYFFPVGDELWNSIRDLAWTVTDPTTSDIVEADLTFSGPSDVATVINGRKEQPQLRARLLSGRTVAECGVCGRLLPARYLRAAHIKKRSTATEKERRDPNIAMLACVLGCDQAFECGDIRIQADGTIKLADSNDAFLHENFGALEGKNAPAFNTSTRKYFADRTESFFDARKVKTENNGE